MPILRILNPANGKPVASLPADDVRSIKAKYAAARSAQPRWAATPMTVAALKCIMLQRTKLRFTLQAYEPEPEAKPKNVQNFN